MRMTQRDLAEKMGVSVPWVGCVEIGKRAIPLGRIARLAHHLGVEAGTLVMSATPAERSAVEAFMRGPETALDALVGRKRPARGEMAPDDERHRGRVGAGIAAARKRAKLSQNELAKLARVPRPNVSFAEAGSRCLARDEAARLEMVLRLKPGTLSDMPEQAAARLEAAAPDLQQAPRVVTEFHVRRYLGAAIASEMQARRIDTRSLSALTFIPHPRLLRIIGGTLKPHRETLALIARRLNTTEGQVWSRAEEIAKIAVDEAH